MHAAKRIFYVSLQAIGGDGVRYDCSTLVALQCNGGCNGDQAVAVDFIAMGIHSAAAVYVLSLIHIFGLLKSV